ncbi:Hypothetical predicted protein [Paramuricea clavata]|uniref:Uncharacterized protein n=1 Tax=Paramuricea clavata TaxID=317549 RepID=A0A7D9KYP7_PARCT|nr:Hypothetical predicted protein [Paramuricea clavata]
MTNSVGEAVDYLVMPGGDCWHVGGSMTEDMGKGFILVAVATGRACVRPAMFYSVDGQAIEVSTMDKSPVLEAHVEACVVPFGAISKLIIRKGARNFALVTEVTKGFRRVLTFKVMEEAANIFRGNFVSIIRSRDGG